MIEKLGRALRIVNPKYGLKKSDIILASFPKSGNTWLRFIWANIISLLEYDGKRVDFHRLINSMGSEYEKFNFRDIESEHLPRLVKTHKPYDNKAFGQNKCAYILRNPGDVMVSYYEYRKALKNVKEEKSISQLIRNGCHGIRAWCSHVKAWIKESDLIIKYEDLKKDSVGVTKKLVYGLCGAAIPEEVLLKANERSKFDNLKQLEIERGRPNEHQFEEGFRFLRSGKNKNWKDRLEEKDIEYIKERVNENGLSKFFR